MESRSSTTILRCQVFTTMIIMQSDKVLLGLKKRGYGRGKWTGFGGKVHADETIYQAAQRELTEEAGIRAVDAKRRGVLTFQFLGDPTLLEVHVFQASQFVGTLTETEEMRPKWWRRSDTPYSRMWADDRMWFSMMLNPSVEAIRGQYLFHGETVVQSEVYNCSQANLPNRVSPRMRSGSVPSILSLSSSSSIITSMITAQQEEEQMNNACLSQPTRSYSQPSIYTHHYNDKKNNNNQETVQCQSEKRRKLLNNGEEERFMYAVGHNITLPWWAPNHNGGSNIDKIFPTFSLKTSAPTCKIR